MNTVYLVCFLLGGTLLVCQFLLSLIGFGDHHDTDADHDVHHDAGGHDAHDHHGHGDHPTHSAWFIGVLTFRTLVAALTFFGLTGLATAGKLEQPLNFLVAIAGGVGAMFLVASLMRTLHKLKAEGTVRIQRAVGQPGTVYLGIPAQKAGAGKVTLSLQNRTVEYQAVTPYQALPTGSRIVVIGVVGPDTVEVVPATES
jgi:hypothetical protein